MRSLALLLLCSACGVSPPSPGADGGPGPDAAVVYCPAAGRYALDAYGCDEGVGCPPVLPGVDDDGDGASELAGDCDDSTPWVSPNATEVCDLRDNDCDGLVDEDGVCPDPAVACPLSFAEVRCCDATHTIAGSFYELDSSGTPSIYSPGGGFADPFAVLVRRRDTGELRYAITCAAPPPTAGGYPFRFYLRDEEFVVPGARYELLMHLRWYLPWAAAPSGDCWRRVPVVTTDAETAAVCLDYGPLVLSCL